MTPSQRILQFFGRLPVDDITKAEINKVQTAFADFAASLIVLIPESAEGTVAYRKLLEAKDCAVRAVIAHN